MSGVVTGVVIRAKAHDLLKQAGHALTSAEIAQAIGMTRAAVTAALSNAPRDMFKRAHGTREEGGKQSVLWELGSRGKPAPAIGLWSA